MLLSNFLLLPNKNVWFPRITEIIQPVFGQSFNTELADLRISRRCADICLMQEDDLRICAASV